MGGSGSWAAQEFEEIDLGDERLNKRTVLLAKCLAANPLASIPQACGSWARTQAAYRYLAQDEVRWSDILEPSVAAETAASTTSRTFRKKARSSAARVSSLNTVTDASSDDRERPTWVLRNAWSDAISPFLHTSR
jgi:hypothetical protein